MRLFVFLQKEMLHYTKYGLFLAVGNLSKCKFSQFVTQ
jgi:hypothetical protein